MLPKRIAALDIETSKTNFAKPENSKLAIAGIKFYVLGGDRYRAKEFNYFLLEQIPALESTLKQFDGIIIGHNIFEFDYRVLGPLISLDGIIEKTVDTLAFLYKKNGNEMGGLSLDSLSRINFRKKKTIQGKSISELWNKGERKKVIDYNENDCMLSKGLWWNLVNKRSIRIGDGLDKSLRITTRDISSLIGKKPMFTSFQVWQQRIMTHGHAFKDKQVRKHLEVNDNGAGLKPDSKAIFHRLFCGQCQHHFLLVADIGRVFSTGETITCPGCGYIEMVSEIYRGTLAQIHPFARFVVSFGTTLPSEAELAVEPTVARKAIRRLRWWG